MELNAQTKLAALKAEHNVLGSTVSVGDYCNQLRAHALAGDGANSWVGPLKESPSTFSPEPTKGSRKCPTAWLAIQMNSVLEDKILQPAAINLQRLVEAYREHGHKKAVVDPLGLKELSVVPELEPGLYGLSLEDLKAHDLSGVLECGQCSATTSQVVAILENLYCGTMAVQFQHLSTADERSWFATKFERGQKRDTFDYDPVASAVLMLKAQAFDRFAASKFAAVKRYGAEGAEGALLFCDELFRTSAQMSLSDVVVCIAHRGRLNLLTCLLKYPPAVVFRKMKGLSEFPPDLLAAGDVLSHLSTSVDLQYNNESLHVMLLPNTSHLEAVNAVAVGKARGKERTLGAGSYSASDEAPPGDRVITLQIHGDAAFAGQGIVAETFAMADVPHFTVGGSIHLIINNQIGFTTEGSRSRSSQYCSDIGKLNNCPIIHVNADYPEGAVRAARLAMQYRQTFHKDVLVDYVCYRQWGHNEMDEPAFTQPLMYGVIRARPTTPDQYAQRVVDEGACSKTHLEEQVLGFRAELQDAFQQVDTYIPKARQLEKQWSDVVRASHDVITTWDTGCDARLLRYVGAASVSVPPGMKIHDTLTKSHVNRRLEKLRCNEAVDWATAEALAIGSLLYQGFSVRLSGQDVGRGTFSHRHATLVDQVTGQSVVPLNHLGNEQTAFLEVANSVLSEEAVLGFEFGMSLDNPNALHLWEAQFGDFFNGAQIIIDGFISGSETKWLLHSSLVMLLPHGIDGTGPEHSSCRLERFLQLCDSREDAVDSDDVNLQVANPTTPAQYFHLLRRQMLRNFRKPLVIAAPKLLLRHAAATSRLEDMSPGTHVAAVLADDGVVESRVTRVVFVCGQHYYSLTGQRGKAGGDTAIVRLEILCPFPANEIHRVLQKYPKAKEFIWSQEEHRNQGAWSYVAPRFNNIIGIKLKYVGRKVHATPAVGIGSIHQREARQIVEETFA